ncbi:hypothetical protein MD484_g7590, partial [Candolleomyces efflorescens]
MALFENAHHFSIDNATVFTTAHNVHVLNIQTHDLIRRLNPILDASHTRNRKQSPPDSECFPGTREKPIQEIAVWADSPLTIRIRTRKAALCRRAKYITKTTPHIYWLHGFAGCGKSSISLTVAKLYAGSGRLLASYFFFRGAGDRSTMNRFADTLASQVIAAIPATAPLIQAAVRARPGLVTGNLSLAMQLDCLVLSPFMSVFEDGALRQALSEGPFLIVIDGFDECEDKQGVQDFIDHIRKFFEEHPTIPLRIFIASRVQEHISAHLETEGVVLGNLDNHSTQADIERFLKASFAVLARRDPAIRGFVITNGSWPAKQDLDKLIEQIGGSFVLASTMFKYIVQPPTEGDPATPVERLSLILTLNGLDDLYARTLSRSQHLPHFYEIISTIILLVEPLPIAGISALLGIGTSNVTRVLLNLQAIIQVPKTDAVDKVTLCHRSLREFLTTESRSGAFFLSNTVHGSLKTYCWFHFADHWRGFATSDACDFFTEIEQFKVHRSTLVNRIPHHAFLSSALFYTLFMMKATLSDDSQDVHDHRMLTACAQELVLATECADGNIELWLEEEVHYNSKEDHTMQFSEHTLEALQRDLKRASIAIHTHSPGILEAQSSTPSGKEPEWILDRNHISGADIFNVCATLDSGPC